MDLVSIKSNPFSFASEIFAAELVARKEGKSASFRCRTNADWSNLNTRSASTFHIVPVLLF
jgi:hypothetical protein